MAGQHPAKRRRGFVAGAGTNAYRVLHGAAHGFPGEYVERLGDWLLWETTNPDARKPPRVAFAAKGVYRKLLRRHVRATSAVDAAPMLVRGQPAPDRFEVRENDVRFELSFVEGYSYGLFLDQRENRGALLNGRVADDFRLFEDGLAGRRVLNAFAYTCAFSVCAGLAGAETTSLDLSRKYLDWGRRNFVANGLAVDAHDFIYGDVFDWFRRFRNKGRVFDLVMLDPPTFSKSKKKGVFQVERDYALLAEQAARLVAAEGVLFCSTNAAGWSIDGFRDAIAIGLRAAGRRVTGERFVGQPADFPVTPEQPAYLKTFWLRLN